MANGIEFSLSLDDSQLRKLVEKAPPAVLLRLRQLVEGAAIDVQREMRIQAPVAVTGQLRGSIRYAFNAGTLSAVISPNVPYAADVEYGSKPRFVSVAEGSPLRKWAKLKGLNPYAVQRAIAKKGTRPHPFVTPTYNRMKPIVQRDIADGVMELIGRLNSGQL